jgi:hypothetical protein
MAVIKVNREMQESRGQSRFEVGEVYVWGGCGCNEVVAEVYQRFMEIFTDLWACFQSDVEESIKP